MVSTSSTTTQSFGRWNNARRLYVRKYGVCNVCYRKDCREAANCRYILLLLWGWKSAFSPFSQVVNMPNLITVGQRGYEYCKNCPPRVQTFNVSQGHRMWHGSTSVTDCDFLLVIHSNYGIRKQFPRLMAISIETLKLVFTLFSPPHVENHIVGIL